MQGGMWAHLNKSAKLCTAMGDCSGTLSTNSGSVCCLTLWVWSLAWKLPCLLCVSPAERYVCTTSRASVGCSSSQHSWVHVGSYWCMFTTIQGWNASIFEFCCAAKANVHHTACQSTQCSEPGHDEKPQTRSHCERWLSCHVHIRPHSLGRFGPIYSEIILGSMNLQL